MNSPADLAPLSNDAVDPVLADLVEGLTARLQSGEALELDAVALEHPHYAEQLRQLWPTLKALAEAGQPASSPPAVVAPTEPPGLVLGDFRIVRQVGRGGMGVVYEAVQESLGRHVALKVLPGHAGLAPNQLERFRREAKAAARMHHSNIVPVFGVGEHGGVHFYAMQFIDGQGLDAVLREVRREEPPGPPVAPSPSARPPATGKPAGGPTVAANTLILHKPAPDQQAEPAPPVAAETPGPCAAGSTPTLVGPARGKPDGLRALYLRDPAGYFRTVARAGIQVAEGLHYAHEQGIFHRDVKPSNLLLDAHGTVWITDFGLAKLEGAAELTDSGDLLGTLRYMAPERFDGKADARSDVYSLGITLLELLTRRPAFDESDRLKLVERITHAGPAAPRKHDRRIPRDLETIVLKAVAREPDRRYPTAGELADDLRLFLAGEPIRARPAGPFERLLLWARRRPTAAALLVVSVVAAMALVGLTVAAVYQVWLTDALAQVHGALEAETVAKQQAEEARGVADQQRQAAAAAEGEAQRQARLAQEALAKANSYLYLHRVALAQREWHDGHVARAEELLDACPADLRHWEWHYLKRLCHGETLTLRGHTSDVTGLAYSPDGKRLATACLDGRMRIWDLENAGQRPLVGTLGRMAVHGVTFGADGKLLAAVGDFRARVWDFSTRKELLATAAAEGDDRTHGGKCLALHPEGKLLAVGGWDGHVRLWDIPERKEVRAIKAHQGFLASVAFSPDGKLLASGGHDHKLHLWDVATGQNVRSMKAPDETVAGVAFSPDGRQLASAGYDGTVRLWEVATGREAGVLKGHAGQVLCVTFSPDGQRLASAGTDQIVRVWDAAGREAMALHGHNGRITGVAFSPDGQHLASAGKDRTVRVWGARGGPDAMTLPGIGALSGTAFSPDGRLLAAGSGQGVVLLWDAATGQAVRRLPGPRGTVHGVAFSPDGTLLAAAGRVARTSQGPPEPGEVKLWEVATGQEVRTFVGHTLDVNCVVFSPDGQRLVTASADRTVRVWGVATGKEELALKGHTSMIEGLAISPDGRLLASGGWDKIVKVWDAATGQERFTLKGHRSGIHAVAFRGDGQRLASASADGTVRVWDMATGKELLMLRGHPGPVMSVRFSPDDRRLASAGGGNSGEGLLLPGEVKMWDPETGQETLTLKGHKERILGLAFSPDGRRLATTSADSTAKVWDATPRTP